MKTYFVYVYLQVPRERPSLIALNKCKWSTLHTKCLDDASTHMRISTSTSVTEEEEEEEEELEELEEEENMDIIG